MRKEDQLSALSHYQPAQAEYYVSLTNNQWAIYYYLLSISDYNSYKKEDHRYVYKKNINVSQISRDFGFSRATYYNTLKALRNKDLIQYDDKSDYIILPLPKIYTKISKKLIGQLLYYREQFTIDLLRVYLFCGCIYDHFGSSKKFTLRNVVKCLGHSDKRMEYYKIVEIALDLLSIWGLIDFSTEMINSSEFGLYRVYRIRNFYNASSELDSRFNQTGMMSNNDGLTEQEMEKAKELLNFK